MRLKRVIGALLTLCCAAPLQAAWHEARTPHFVVYSEGSPDAIRKFANNLERFDQALRKLLQFNDRAGDDPNPVTVFFLDNIRAINDLCRGGEAKADAAKACRNIAGFYNGRASGSVAFVPRSTGGGPQDAQIILFHEYAHHLMLANSVGAYPAWYVEGFAEFVSNAKLDKEGVVGIGMPANSRAWSLREQTAMPVRTVMTTSPSKLTPGDTSVFYGRAWLLTHYLTFASTRDDQLTRYLTAINDGASIEAAATTAFGDLDALNREVDAYLQRNRFAYLPVPVSPIPADAIRIRRLEAGEAAMMPVRVQSQRAVDSESAPKVAAQARGVAAAWPDDPGAQVILAEAEFDAGNIEAAEAAADRALAVDARNRPAMIFKAQALMERARKDNHFDEASWRTARAWLLRANKIEVDAAWPLVLFYRSFLEQGNKPTGNAVIALERGLELAPQDRGVRWMLVNHYMRDRKLPEARATLLPLAYDPHASTGNPARKLLDRIDQRIAGKVGADVPTIDMASDLSLEEAQPQ